MSLPLPAVRGLLILALAATVPIACTESASDSDLLLALSINKRRFNVAERNDLGLTPEIVVTANAPGASDTGHIVAVTLSDYALFHKSGADINPPDSFALMGLTNGQGRAQARCSGNVGTATVTGFLLDGSTGEPVGEATSSFECYLDDPLKYTLTLTLKDSVAAVGECVEAELRGFKDDRSPAQGLFANLGCTGCQREGQDSSELDDINEGELNEISLPLDNDGIATAKLCCLDQGRVGVRGDWQEARFGDPDETLSAAFDCIEQGGEPDILVNPDPVPPPRVGNDPTTSRRALTVILRGPGGAPVEFGTINQISTNRGMLTLTKENTPPPLNRKVLDLVALDQTGRAEFYFWAGTEPGIAALNLSARVRVPGQDDLILGKRIEIPIIGLGEIECIPPAAPFLTVAGSGGKETLEVCFQVRSTQDEPLTNFAVEFTLPTTLPCEGADPSACGTAWIAPTRAETNSEGVACTFLHAGRSAQPVAVRATGRLHGAAFVSDCPAVPVVGGRPSARGMALTCEDLNVGGLIHTDGINSLIDHETRCHASIKDRFGNPVVQATNLSFGSEAGTISHSVRTPGRPEGGAAEGDRPKISQGTAIFSTFGQLPKDVDPLPRDPDAGRDRAEPSYEDADGRIRNPRDGLVTIIAWAVGEEEFTDLDANGEYTPGEPFVDQAEPFVDSNDNGLRDLDERFIDFDPREVEGAADPFCPEGVARRSRLGIHDGPNGCWDPSGLIWTQTRLLETGRPFSRGDDRSSGFLSFGLAGDEPRFRLQKQDFQKFKVRVVDRNLNLMNPSMKLTLLTRGATEIIAGATTRFSAPDSLGIGFSLRKSCNALTQICAITPTIAGFNEWAEDDGSGFEFHFTAGANAAIDGPCCAPRPPPESEEPPDLLDEDRADPRCAPPEGYAFPDEVPDPPPEVAEGEGEESPEILPWYPGLYQDTLLRVTAAYGIAASGGGQWEDQYEISGWSCGDVVFDEASEDDIEAQTACINGRVLGPRDVPIEGAVVRVLDPDEGFNPQPATTDENGAYCVISSLGPHNFQAEFTSEGGDGFQCRSEVLSFQVALNQGEAECGPDCWAGPVLTCEAIEGEGGDAGGGEDAGGADGAADGGGDADGGADGGEPDGGAEGGEGQ